MAKFIRVEMKKKLEKKFPSGLQWSISYETTQFVDISIKGVIKTFIEALLLVLIVVFLFLES
ncbi:MAG: efflux RND transporter permease subunit [Flavobacteriales bacterium AspAUS03]